METMESTPSYIKNTTVSHPKFGEIITYGSRDSPSFPEDGYVSSENDWNPYENNYD